MRPRQSGLQPQRVLLLVAFAFAVMADPVSSVAMRSRLRCGR